MICCVWGNILLDTGLNGEPAEAELGAPLAQAEILTDYGEHLLDLVDRRTLRLIFARNQLEREHSPGPDGLEQLNLGAAESATIKVQRRRQILVWQDDGPVVDGQLQNSLGGVELLIPVSAVDGDVRASLTEGPDTTGVFSVFAQDRGCQADLDEYDHRIAICR